MRKLKRQSQPRIAGRRREPSGTALPKHVNADLERIADAEGKSLSWVRAQIIYDFLGYDETGWR